MERYPECLGGGAAKGPHTRWFPLNFHGTNGDTKNILSVYYRQHVLSDLCMVSKIFKLTNENYDVNPNLNLKTHAVSECQVYGVVMYIYVTLMIFGFAMKNLSCL